jgi:Major Facilitator Superfamily
VFVNLWGYTQLEAAFAIVPVPLCGLLAWPFVGRAADTKPPGELAKPALIAMAVGMLWVSFLPATSDDAWAYIRILPGLLLIGAGMGIGFPALNVGAMGAVTGQDLGLASGVLNTARQLGVAIGVAILIATFGGALHAHMSWFADDEIEDIVDEWEVRPPLSTMVIQSTLHDYTGGTEDRFEPKPGFDEEIVRETAGSAREGFAWAFRQAAILVLSALPLMGALRRTPAQARAEAMAAAAGQGPPPPDGDGRAAEGDGAPHGAPAPGAEPRPA